QRGDQAEEGPVGVEDEPAGPHVDPGRAQAVRRDRPALAAIGGLVHTGLEGRGIERPAPLRTLRVYDHRGDRLAGEAWRGVLPGYTEVGADGDAPGRPRAVVPSGDDI